MTKLYIHIGFGKCGSSAIQGYFTQNPVVRKKTKGNIYYAVINGQGNVVFGNDIKSLPKTPFGYQSSVSLHHIVKRTDDSIKKKLAEIFDNINEEDDLLLSNEGWCNEYDLASDLMLLLPSNIAVQVIAIVRPPVEWINSAWWQWGAWSDVSFERWVKKNISIVKDWTTVVEKWSRKLNSEKIILPLTSNIITDFSELLELVELPSSKSNSSLPEELLRVFQRNRSLRKGPHDSSIEFTLANKIDFSKYKNKTPWVIDSNLTGVIIEETKVMFVDALSYMPMKYHKKFIDNKRWTSVEEYAGKRVSPSGVIPDNSDKDKLVVDLIKAMID